MDFEEAWRLMDQVARGRMMLVWIDHQYRAFVPMPQPPPVLDPVLEQQWADALADDIADGGLVHRLPPGWVVAPDNQVIVFDAAGQIVPA